MNLSIKSGGCTQYENITLKVTGKSVKLQVNDKTGKNIVDKSSYGGRYQAKGF